MGAVLITGASRGIGRATAERLARAGREVVGFARGAGEGAFPGHLIAVDLADRAATQSALDAVADRFEIDGLVNNIGLNVRQRLEEVDLATFDRVIDMNLRTAIQCAQAVIPGMRRRRRGRIVNLASRAMVGRTACGSYAAAKSALYGLTRSWALELAADGITANVVAPGATATDMFKKNNLVEYGAASGKPLSFFAGQIPVGRLAEPDEIAAPIEFFLSEAASYVTGQVLIVCGGLSIGPAEW